MPVRSRIDLHNLLEVLYSINGPLQAIVDRRKSKLPSAIRGSSRQAFSGTPYPPSSVLSYPGFHHAQQRYNIVRVFLSATRRKNICSRELPRASRKRAWYE